jgi:hypothetical protein
MAIQQAVLPVSVLNGCICLSSLPDEKNFPASLENLSANAARQPAEEASPFREMPELS